MHVPVTNFVYSELFREQKQAQVSSGTIPVVAEMIKPTIKVMIFVV